MYVISIFMMEWDRNHACLAFTAFTLLFMSYVVSMYQWMFRSYPSPFSCIFTHHTTQIHIISNIIYSLPPCFIYIAFCSCSSHVFNSLSCLIVAVSIVVAVCVYVCVLFLLSFLFFIAMLQLVLFSPLLQCGCVLCVMRGGTRDGGPTVSHSCLTRKLSFSSFLPSSIIQLLCPIGAAVVCVCVCVACFCFCVCLFLFY